MPWGNKGQSSNLGSLSGYGVTFNQHTCTQLQKNKVKRLTFYNAVLNSYSYTVYTSISFRVINIQPYLFVKSTLTVEFSD